MSDRIVALAASKEQLALTQAQRDGKRIHNLAKRHGSVLATVWDKEMHEALDYALLVLRNNKGRGEVVADRPDVIYAIAKAAEAAAQASEARLNIAWNSGSILGNAVARRQAKLWGLDKPKPFSPDKALLDSIKLDITAMGEDVREALDKAIRAEDEDAMGKAVSSVVLRSRMSGEAAAKFAAQGALGGALKAAGGVYKKWTTTSALPCTNCLALAAHPPILWADEFPHAFPGVPELKVYGGKLLSPPRHPNCACVLVATKEP